MTLMRMFVVAQSFLVSALLIFWAEKILVVEAVLCFVGCLAASLASIYQMSVAPLHICGNQKCHQALSNVHGWCVKLSPTENHLL